MMRGSPTVFVTRPLVSDVEPICTVGFAQFEWLNRLNASTRSSMRLPPDRFKLRENYASTFQKPGPTRYPFGVFPHRPGVLGANAARLYQASACWLPVTAHVFWSSGK